MPAISAPPLKRRLLETLQAALGVSAIGSAYAALVRAQGAIILMYHSVAQADSASWVDPHNHMPPEIFRRQMRFLARRRRVVSMDELVETLSQGRTPPRKTVVITIDDGYLDTFTTAAPILAEFRLPATLYLATGYVERGENQWIDRLHGIFRTRTRNRLAWPPESPQDCRLDAADDCASIYHALVQRLLPCNWEERRALFEDLAAQLAPDTAPPRLTLRWDEVKEMNRRYPDLAIGGHTRDHLDLSGMSRDQVRTEVERCAADLQQQLGALPHHFSYPYNRVSEIAQAELAQCGFRSAAASGTEVLIRSGAPCYALPRVQAPCGIQRLAFITSGAYPKLSARLTGRF